MRPPRNAGEMLQTKLCLQRGGILASMRPPRNAGEMVGTPVPHAAFDAPLQ